MPQVTANGLKIEYDAHGKDGDPPILLIMGLGAQMTLWPIEFVEALVARGFHVIRYDNRDIGLSQKFDGVKAPSLPWQIIRTRLGFPPKVPYTLADMAADGVGVLDALGIDSAHIVGASMGGMITQHFGFSHGERVRSLTSIMSTTGHPKLPQADPEAMKALTKRPTTTDIDELVEHGVYVWRTIGSPGIPADDPRLRQRVRETLERSFYPAGPARQIAAIIADGDRRERLKQITAPTLVLHGEADPLVKLAGGEDTAAHIAGAKLTTFPGMGHDLPLDLIDSMAGAIAEHAKAADQA